MTLGEKLQLLRARSGLSQEDLAERLAVSRQAVSKWELDKTVPEVRYIVTLSELFGVTTDFLLKEDAVLPSPAAADSPEDRSAKAPEPDSTSPRGGGKRPAQDAAPAHAPDPLAAVRGQRRLRTASLLLLCGAALMVLCAAGILVLLPYWLYYKFIWAVYVVALIPGVLPPLVAGSLVKGATLDAASRRRFARSLSWYLTLWGLLWSMALGLWEVTSDLLLSRVMGLPGIPLYLLILAALTAAIHLAARLLVRLGLGRLPAPASPL